MVAEPYNLIIQKGETLALVVTYKNPAGSPINLSGYTARMQARSSYASSSTLIELTTENGGITLGGAAGTITLNMTASATAALTFETAVYDLEIITGSTVIRLMQGPLTVTPEVTR